LAGSWASAAPVVRVRAPRQAASTSCFIVDSFRIAE
jgi:hypothetical protein